MRSLENQKQHKSLRDKLEDGVWDDCTLSEVASVSSAISLKRIADRFDGIFTDSSTEFNMNDLIRYMVGR